MPVAMKRNAHSAVEPPTTGPNADEVELALRQSGYGGLRSLRCECHGGVIVINGQVASFFLKQMAQTVVARLEGVSRVQNLVEVI